MWRGTSQQEFLNLIASAALRDIIHSSEAVQDAVRHIPTAATQQAAATADVNYRMEQIANMVQMAVVADDNQLVLRVCSY